VQNLRACTRVALSVDALEATVTDLIECSTHGRWPAYRRAGTDNKEAFYADPAVIADGSFSDIRNAVMGANNALNKTSRA
jgi:squalene monooxygenase